MGVEERGSGDLSPEGVNLTGMARTWPNSGYLSVGIWRMLENKANVIWAYKRMNQSFRSHDKEIKERSTSRAFQLA